MKKFGTGLFMLLCLNMIVYTSIIAQTKGLYLPNNQGGTTLAASEQRIALIIGNQEYENWSNLAAPVADAELVEKSLKKCGFETQVLQNAGRAEMVSAINDFISKIKGKETVALIFFGGHGAEFDGTNYLIPVDDKSSCRTELNDYSITLSSIHTKMEEANVGMNILLVDACRTQSIPFTCASDTRNDRSRGLAEYEPEHTFISFSTAPGTVANDRQPGEQNSPYAIALANTLQQPNLKIEEVFKRVSRKLSTQGQQPWVRNNFYGDFYFYPVAEETEGQKDSDGDGLIDEKDNCPNEYGDISNYGCPRSKAILEDFTEFVGDTRLQMTYLSSGSFDRGYRKGGSNEQPVKEIALDDFYMGKYEVTVDQYLAFCRATDTHWPEWLEKGNQYNIQEELNPFYREKGYSLSKSGGLPIVGVSWEDANAYCKWLSKETGKKYRLPTEAEWEYAAKQGLAEAPSDEELIEQAWMSENSDNKPHPVGLRKSNAAGLSDMFGNVWEWCADAYDANFYEKSDTENPLNTALSDERVLRGGAWNSSAPSCMPYNRHHDTADNRNANTGFRVVVEVQ